MKSALPVLLLLLAPALAMPAGAQTEPPRHGTSAAANGCGTGWNTYLVPDSLPYLGCRFETACNQHDACYGKCLPGGADAQAAHCRYTHCRPDGALNGQAMCRSTAFKQLAVAANARRLNCDAGFYRDLLAANPQRPVCQAFALLYREMVQRFGASAFVGAGAEDNFGPPLWAIPDDADRAIRELLTRQTPAHLDSVIKALQPPPSPGTPAQQKPRLDLARPLHYDPERGLVNP